MRDADRWPVRDGAGNVRQQKAAAAPLCSLPHPRRAPAITRSQLHGLAWMLFFPCRLRHGLEVPPSGERGVGCAREDGELELRPCHPSYSILLGGVDGLGEQG